MFDHYIALDWAQQNMAIARITRHGNKPTVIDVQASIDALKIYLGKLRGTKVLTFEETTTAQWLYTELRAEVDEIVVCDPYKNRLLSLGPTTDKIAATKLVTLLHAGLLKPVFHTADKFIYFRKLLSGYEDLVKAGVRLKNQRSAMFRAIGLSKKEKELENPAEVFVLKGIDEGIANYEKEKIRYEERFHEIYLKHDIVRNLESIPGIGEIGAIKIAATVVDPRRFKRKGYFLSFCGLVRLDKVSGGRSYGTKRPRYCRRLKSVFDIAAINTISERSKSSLRVFYQSLLQKGYAEHNARHAVARRIAIIAYGILKTQRRFEPKAVK